MLICRVQFASATLAACRQHELSWRRLLWVAHGAGSDSPMQFQYVKYGWFGSLKIFSKAAFETLLGSTASCENGGNDWKVGIDGGKLGPMGEDLFAQACLDANGALDRVRLQAGRDRCSGEKRVSQFESGLPGGRALPHTA
ncbi:unnamed protein product [Prorocentrum cordatum]|uniref:Uncharacterized protein n=1 Tax=Prorocentrum cordatum TaxID=2364126 RepID=A0ABN9R620_9DINO|nr:unnamed protein product [Polarella glacialis]